MRRKSIQDLKHSFLLIRFLGHSLLSDGMHLGYSLELFLTIGRSKSIFVVLNVKIS